MSAVLERRQHHIAIGAILGRVEVLDRTDDGRYLCRCRCPARTRVILSASALLQRPVPSCGCYIAEVNRENMRRLVARVSPSHVLEMRRLWYGGHMSTTELAARYGLSRSAVWSAVTGRSWGDVR